MANITIRVPDDLHVKLRKFAQDHNVRVSDVIRVIADRYLGDPELDQLFRDREEGGNSAEWARLLELIERDEADMF